DLSVAYSGYDSGKKELKFKVANVGDERSDDAILRVDTLMPGASAPVNSKSFKIDELNRHGSSNHTSATHTYKLEQACAPGLRVQAQVLLDADPRPENDQVVVRPCQPDLRIAFDKRVSAEKLDFKVTNYGGVTIPEATVHFETE